MKNKFCPRWDSNPPKPHSLSTVRPSWSSGKTPAANAGGRGFESHRGQNLFFKFTLFYGVECEKLFCKTNIKLKVLKLNKQNLFQNLDDIKLRTLKQTYKRLQNLYKLTVISLRVYAA